MGFVYDDVGATSRHEVLDDLDYLREGTEIPVHTIQTLDGDEYSGFSLHNLGMFSQDTPKAFLKGNHGIMTEAVGRPSSSRGAEPLPTRCMNQFIVDDNVIFLWDTGEKCRVGTEARMEKQRRRRPKETLNATLERVVLF
jgi:hypothetical protein